MGRPRVVPGAEDTRERLLRAAVPAFAAHGFARATLAGIADGAGIRRPSLLHHFPTKEALYAEVVGRVFGELGAALGAAMGSPGPFDARVEALCRAFTTFLHAHPDHARLVVRELVDGDGPGAAILRGPVAPLLDGVVAFVATGGPRLRDVPVRAGVLQIVGDTLLSAAAGPSGLGGVLWGGPDADRTWALARATFLREPFPLVPEAS